jgi:hypothetical protein
VVAAAEAATRREETYGSLFIPQQTLGPPLDAGATGKGWSYDSKLVGARNKSGHDDLFLLDRVTSLPGLPRPSTPTAIMPWLPGKRSFRSPQLYRTGEKDAGINSLFSWRTGRTPACGGQAPPGRRDSSRTRARSFRSL